MGFETERMRCYPSNTIQSAMPVVLERSSGPGDSLSEPNERSIAITSGAFFAEGQGSRNAYFVLSCKDAQDAPIARQKAASQI